MADKLHFNLVSPERQLAAREVHMVVVPGEDGDFGVLADHAPLMSTIRLGTIDIYDAETGAPERIFVGGGFAEIGEGGLTILAEEAVPVGELKPEAIARDLADAREDVKLARDEAQAAHAQSAVARLEAMQAAAVN